MKYLLDFSTLRSASKGLGSYGFHRYLQEAWGTEGLTQLLDIARLVDLFVLSDEILVSERIAQADMPNEVANIVKFIPLDKSSSYFADLRIYADDMEDVKRAMSSMERLLGFKVTEDFVNEIEYELTDDDYRYVEVLANKLSAFTTAPLIGLLKSKNRVFCSLVARTFQYLQTADKRSIPYVCHAYRSPMVRTFHPRLTASPFDLYSECESKIRSWLVENFGNDRLEFQLPMFFLYVLRETQHPDQLFSVASQFRNSDEVVRIKRLLSEIVDENNRVNLGRFAKLRRIADEQTKRFQKQFTPRREDESKWPVSAEISVSPTSIGAKASVDLLKASRELVRWLTEWNDRRGIAVIFKMSRKTYEVLSVEDDLYRLWGVHLTPRHKELLQQISQHYDSMG
jgi:hypothetical protein